MMRGGEVAAGPPSVLLFLALLATGCGGEGEPEAAAEVGVPVGVWTVEARELQTERRWTGRIEPLRTLEARAPGAGQVAAVEKRDGEEVREGEVVVRLAGPDVEARLAVLQERTARLEEELARWERLAEENAAGPGEVAAAVLRLLDAREQAEGLAATVESYVVRAPAEGRIQRTRVRPGIHAGAGDVLFEVEDGSTWGVRLSVAGTEAPLFERIEALSVRDEAGRDLEIERVVLTSDPHPAFVQAEVYLRGADVAHRGALTVTYRSEASRVLLVPWTAVASDGDDHWVARVTSETPPRIERRSVSLGRGHSLGIEVMAGLEAGDRIIRYDPRAHPEGRVVVPTSREREDG